MGHSTTKDKDKDKDKVDDNGELVAWGINVDCLIIHPFV